MLWAPDDWGMCTAQIHTIAEKKPKTLTHSHSHAWAEGCTHSRSIPCLHVFSFMFFRRRPSPHFFFFFFSPSSLFLFPSSYVFSYSLLLSTRHKRSHAVLLVWAEKGGLTPRKEEGWGDFWRRESRPQLMENRCGGEKERKKRDRGEERRGEENKRCMPLPARLKSQFCSTQCFRLTVCVRVAVETLAGRSAAEVRVAEESRLSRRVTQAVFCFNV